MSVPDQYDSHNAVNGLSLLRNTKQRKYHNTIRRAWLPLIQYWKMLTQFNGTYQWPGRQCMRRKLILKWLHIILPQGKFSCTSDRFLITRLMRLDALYGRRTENPRKSGYLNSIIWWFMDIKVFQNIHTYWYVGGLEIDTGELVWMSMSRLAYGWICDWTLNSVANR